MSGIPLTLIGGFLLGVAVRSAVSVDVYMGMAALLVGAAVLYASRHSFHHSLYFVLMLGACVLGIARMEVALNHFEQARIIVEGDIIERAATVRTEPDVRELHTILTLTLDRTVGETTDIVIRTRVPHYPVIEYGDRVVVRGTAHTPEAFETDTGRTFDYRGYLMKDGVHYELLYAEIEPLGVRAGNPLIRALLTTKYAWLAAVSRAVPEPSASLLGGIVVGAKRSLGDSWLDAFRETGIVHIVVLSGYNLTLVALFVVWMTRPFSRTVRLAGGIAGIVAFALMTGGGSTVVRASIMASLGMVALFLARPYAVMRALVIAACIMVCVNPFLLAYDPGFQLSFVATAGLIFGTSIVERYLTHITTTFGLRTIIATTLATQVAVLPLLIYQIGTMSLVAPLVNVLVLPVIPLGMALGFVTGLTGMVAAELAMPFAWVTNIIMEYVFFIIDTFASFPYAALKLPPIPWWGVVVLYGAYTYIVLRSHKSHPPLVKNGWLR